MLFKSEAKNEAFLGVILIFSNARTTLLSRPNGDWGVDHGKKTRSRRLRIRSKITSKAAIFGFTFKDGNQPFILCSLMATITSISASQCISYDFIDSIERHPYNF